MAFVLASNGSQYLIYGCVHYVLGLITQDAKSNITENALMYIFRMGAETLLHSLSLIVATNTIGMHDSNHIEFQLPYVLDQ